MSADATTLTFASLSVVPHGSDVIVGDPARGQYILVPPVGHVVLEALRAGESIERAAVSARESTGVDVDVAGFAEQLITLGFATVAGELREPAPTPRELTRLLRWCCSRCAWGVYVLCALTAIVLLGAHPSLWPRSGDAFFLTTPGRSVVALTLLTWCLAACHEVCHLIAARAEAVPARISLGRRFYFLVLEIDLTGLWSLPRHRRYGPLLAGLAFDFIVLAGVLIAEVTLGGRFFAAITFVETAAIISQCWVFARTDLYAVLITATGCVNLERVTRLMLRRAFWRDSAAQRRELAAATARDVAVATWFRWIHLAGTLAAGAFFVIYFLPVTAGLVSWLATSLAAAAPDTERFWEALISGILLLTPQVVTVVLLARDAGQNQTIRRILRRT